MTSFGTSLRASPPKRTAPDSYVLLGPPICSKLRLIILLILQDTDPIQVSKEIKFTWNPNATVGARLISLEINGTSVQPATNYTIVTLDFIATGTSTLRSAYAAFMLTDAFHRWRRHHP